MDLPSEANLGSEMRGDMVGDTLVKFCEKVAVKIR